MAATVAFVAMGAGAAFATMYAKGPYNTDDNYVHAKVLPAVSYHTFVVDPYDDSKSDFVDWAKFSASATGTPFVIETLSMGALTDTELFVYDSDGTSSLAENDDSSYWSYTLSSKIFFVAPHPGTFYIKLIDDDDQNGSCLLFINKGIARRIGSGSKAAVAAAASQLEFSDTNNPEEGTGEGPDSVVVCNPAVASDVIAAGVLANRLDTTVLFTDKKSLPSQTRSEIDRLLMSYLWDDEYTTVYVVGGTGSVSNAVVSKIAAITNVYQVRRVNKNAANGQLTSWIGTGGGGASGTWWSSTSGSGRVILVNPSNVAEGLLASSLAHGGWATVLFVAKGSVPASTAAFLTTYAPGSVFVMGGTDSIGTQIETWLTANLPSATVTRLRSSVAGGSIYDLAHFVADWGVTNGRFSTGSVVLVSGGSVAEAAPAVSMSREMGVPILFTPKNSLASAVTSFIGTSATDTSYVLGGPEAVSNSVFDKFRLHY